MNCISCDGTMKEYADSSYIRIPVYRCSNCDLAVSGSDDREREIKCNEIYEISYPTTGREESIDLDFTDADGISKQRMFKSQLAYCKEYLKDKMRILEIGSGAGYTLLQFDKMGHDVTGIEPDQRSVRMVNQKLRSGVCLAESEESAKVEGLFDIIWMSHSFEHVIRPLALLQRYSKHLKKDGIIFIEVPNCDNDFILESSIHDHPSTFHYSKKSLTKLAEKARLAVVKSHYIRPPTKKDGAMHKVFKNRHPFYPRIVADASHGTDLRIMLRKF